MTPRHFSDMYRNRSQHRHDQKSEWESFEKDINVLTGMLYNIASAPLKPFIPIIKKIKRNKDDL